MNKHLKHAWVPAAATSMLFMSACEEEKESEMLDNNALLTGEWEIITWDGLTERKITEDYSYHVVFDFQSDGDFGFCFYNESFVNPSDSYEECYEGEWEWIQAGEKVAVSWLEPFFESQDGDIVKGEMVINKLTETELVGTWSYEGEDGSQSDFEIVFEKCSFCD